MIYSMHPFNILDTSSKRNQYIYNLVKTSLPIPASGGSRRGDILCSSKLYLRVSPPPLTMWATLPLRSGSMTVYMYVGIGVYLPTHQSNQPLFQAPTSRDGDTFGRVIMMLLHSL